MHTNVIKDTFTSSMKAAGFKKKGDTWYLDAEEALLVTNLQKSNFGEQYYVNLAVWLKALGAPQFPKEHQCHVRVRATSLDPQRERYWDAEVFNLDHGLTENERGSLIRQFLDATALPFLQKMGSLAELEKLQQDGHLKGAAVLARVQPIIEARRPPRRPAAHSVGAGSPAPAPDDLPLRRAAG